MSVTYRAALKTVRMQAVADDIDSGPAAGTLEVGTAAMALVLATFTCDDPCGVVAGSVLTFSGLTKSVLASNGGTAAEARFKNSTGTTIVSGLTVGTIGTDIIISSTSVSAGQQLDWTAGTITHA